MLSTTRSVSEEVEKEINNPLLENGLNKNKQLVSSKYNNDLGEGNRTQRPIPKPRKSLVQNHNLNVTRFRNNDNDNSISNTLAQQTNRRGLCPDWVSKLGSPPSEIVHFIIYTITRHFGHMRKIADLQHGYCTKWQWIAKNDIRQKRNQFGHLIGLE